MQIIHFLIKALSAFGTQGKIYYVAGTVSNVFKYVATILQPNSMFIILALFKSFIKFIYIMFILVKSLPKLEMNNVRKMK